jgi:hypothetical protein
MRLSLAGGRRSIVGDESPQCILEEAQCHNLRAPLRPASAASHGSMVMWQASRRGINTRIDQHLDLVTTILARPEMTASCLPTYSDHSGCALSRRCYCFFTSLGC